MAAAAQRFGTPPKKRAEDRVGPQGVSNGIRKGIRKGVRMKNKNLCSKYKNPKITKITKIQDMNYAIYIYYKIKM